jgi:hypothetical protein
MQPKQQHDDLESYLKFHQANHQVINAVYKAFSNINPESVTQSSGPKANVIDNMYFAVDGSGSMEALAPEVRTILGVISEAARKSKIPSGMVVAYDGAPTILAEGKSSDQPEATIQKILNYAPRGGTNLSEGALKSIINTSGACQSSGGRLVFVTDCMIADADAELLKTYSTKFGYQTVIMGLGGKENMQAVQKQTGIPVIGLDIMAKEPQLITKFLTEFSDWMRDPANYVSKYPNGRLLSEYKDEVVKPKLSESIVKPRKEFDME